LHLASRRQPSALRHGAEARRTGPQCGWGTLSRVPRRVRLSRLTDSGPVRRRRVHNYSETAGVSVA